MMDKPGGAPAPTVTERLAALEKRLDEAARFVAQMSTTVETVMKSMDEFRVALRKANESMQSAQTIGFHVHLPDGEYSVIKVGDRVQVLPGRAVLTSSTPEQEGAANAD